VPVGTDLCSALLWICKVIEGREEEVVYVLYFTVAFTAVGQCRKNFNAKAQEFRPKQVPQKIFHLSRGIGIDTHALIQ